MKKRKRIKLILEKDEIVLIKGLVKHTDLNDQTIVSVFSHKSRNFNNREIGYFRDVNNPKYDKYGTADKQAVANFLAKYDRFENGTKLIGLQPKEDHFIKLHKASEAMKNAVAIYNNPNIKWKSETFIVNAVIAWTYLMHAYYKNEGVDYSYYHQDGQPLLTNEGRPKLWELSKCIKDENTCPLTKGPITNLKYLIAIRNEIEHSGGEDLDVFISGKLQACAINFNHYLCQWFGNSFSIAQDLAFSIQFSQLAIKSVSRPNSQLQLPATIQTVNRLVESGLTSTEFNDPEYSYRVYIVPRTTNNRNNADQAVKYAPQGSDVEMAIREVDRPKYTAGDIVKVMNEEGFVDFTTHGKNGFVTFWQSIDGKNPANGLGVSVVGQWVWYERMIDEIRKELRIRHG